VAGIVSNEEKFVIDIDSLREILKNPNTKNLLDASAILRRLLLDGHALMHKVAKGRDFKPRFVVPALTLMPMPEGIPEPSFWWTDPSAVHDRPTKDLGLDAFLSEPLHLVDGANITVRQVIDYVANVGGGVHQGKPRDEKAKLIHETSDQTIIMGHAYPLASIRGIVQVTFNALIPLYFRVRA
jgi:hypothetical protein